MAKRISDEEREQIVALFPSGLSCNEIAKRFGRSADTISRIAKSVDHKFGYTNLLNAHETNKAYGAERRANIRLKTVENVERLIGQMFAPATLHNFG